MADLQLLDCFQPELVRLERVRFFQRQLLSVADMVTEQDYIRQKLRRHNRFLHGWGVVCGLEVIPQPTDEAPWRVEITAGYALGPYGDEVYVGESVFLDLAQCGPDAITSPCEPDVLEGASEVSGGTLYVAIKYAECVTQPVRAMPAGCACDEVACEYSRIRDSFELSCLTELPPSPAPPLLCELIAANTVPPCPPCPEEPWVVLASVNLPAPGVGLENSAVDNLVRRQLYSTAMLQEQLIACCCGPREEVSADVAVAITEESNQAFQGIRRLTYRLDVRNHGPSAAHNVMVSNALAIDIGGVAHVEFLPAAQGNWMQTTGPLNPNVTTHTFVAQLGTVHPNPEPQEALSLRFRIRVRPGSGGRILLSNTATVSTDTTDPHPGNNSASLVTDWTQPEPPA
jgi:hypothetical protein